MQDATHTFTFKVMISNLTKFIIAGPPLDMTKLDKWSSLYSVLCISFTNNFLQAESDDVKSRKSITIEPMIICI